MFKNVKSIHDEINFVLLCWKIVGLNPYSKITNENKIIYAKSKNNAILYNVITIIVFFFALSVSSNIQMQEFDLVALITFVLLVTTILSIIITYVSSGYIMKRIIRITHKIWAVDVEMQHKQCYYAPGKQFSITYFTVFITFVCFFESVQKMESSYDKAHHESWSIFILYFVGFMSTGSTLAAFLFFKFELGRRFRTLNNSMRNGYGALEMYNRLYSKLYDTDRMVNDTFQFFLIIKITYYSISLTSNLFYMISTGSGGYIGLFWLLFYSCQVTSWVYFIEVTSRESKKTLVIYEEMTRLRDSTYSKSGLIYLQVKFQRNEFKVCGLFAINWNFVLRMFGNTISNLFILLQFNTLNSTDNKT